MNLSKGITFCLIVLSITIIRKSEENKFINDICGYINDKRIYLEYGETGTLIAKHDNNALVTYLKSTQGIQKHCTVEFITCPSCILKIKFSFLNLSRICGKPSIFGNCGCDYIWIYEPTFEQSSEQFCGRFIDNNASSLEYSSQTRKVVVSFLYSKFYQHAFTLDYSSERNQLILTGSAKFSNLNKNNQIISSPFFPNLYPSDLTMEHIIKCESHNETCRITLVFTDFLLTYSSIIDFFDWNGERIYVTSGNMFRPPVIVSSGPSMVVRFYANGASNFGFKAYYSFILDHGSDTELQPDIDCGGHVNNLGGAITMMDMVEDGLKSYDCVWLIKPPETYLHMKTHLYVKVLVFSEFGGSTELTIHQGLTSEGPIIEHLKYPSTHFHPSEENEHVVPISQGFYVSLRGIFCPQSRLTLVYAAFNYKNCLAGSDFLCRNLRCISKLLNCDGFDHCGDNSDEITCTETSRDRRQWSKTPNFLFPKNENVTPSSLIFFLCILGLIGLVFAISLLLCRHNLTSRHRRHIQNHIETIQAILEEGVGEIEEEIIIPDDPPDYEAPPDYNDCVKIKSVQGTSRSCQSAPARIPDSPPPAYEANNPDEYCKLKRIKIFNNLQWSPSKICKNAIYESLLKNARRLIFISGDISKKYFSDSQLAYSTFNNGDYIDLHISGVNFAPTPKHKSFTTDDINSFL